MIPGEAEVYLPHSTLRKDRPHYHLPGRVEGHEDEARYRVYSACGVLLRTTCECGGTHDRASVLPARLARHIADPCKRCEATR